MISKDAILKNVRIASPCHQAWDNMEGDDRIRYCAACRLNVYNLSDMSRDDAVALLQRSEGRLCVRFYRRADGTVLTRDCPVGVRAIRRRIAYSISCACVMFASIAAFALQRGREQLSLAASDPFRANERAWRDRQVAPIRYVLDTVDPIPPAPPQIQVMVGDLAMGSPAPPIVQGSRNGATTFGH